MNPSPEEKQPDDPVQITHDNLYAQVWESDLGCPSFNRYDNTLPTETPKIEVERRRTEDTPQLHHSDNIKPSPANTH